LNIGKKEFMKKIISYSLWGDNPKYIKGAFENLRGQTRYYPKWKCRFYCHDSVPYAAITELEMNGAEIVIKEGDLGVDMDRPGMFWRFEVLKDPEVERFIVRDADSRLTQRERNCVSDWIRSKKNFHIIRDHAMHGTKIMGGMWGATRTFAETIDYDMLVTDFERSKGKSVYGTDQDFLAQFIYPLLGDDKLVHDDFDRFNERARKIPHVAQIGEYIGKPIEV
jgi:protein O-GlcNAc transferase